MYFLVTFTSLDKNSINNKCANFLLKHMINPNKSVVNNYLLIILVDHLKAIATELDILYLPKQLISMVEGWEGVIM